MTIDLLSATMYFMGVLGLLAISWIPLRLLWSLRMWKDARTLDATATKICCGLSLLACLVAVVADAFMVAPSPPVLPLAHAVGAMRRGGFMRRCLVPFTWLSR